MLINNPFLKVLGILKPFFQEGFKPPEAVLPLPDKPKFERRLKRYYGIDAVFCEAENLFDNSQIPLEKSWALWYTVMEYICMRSHARDPAFKEPLP